VFHNFAEINIFFTIGLIKQSSCAFGFEDFKKFCPCRGSNSLEIAVFVGGEGFSQTFHVYFSISLPILDTFEFVVDHQNRNPKNNIENMLSRIKMNRGAINLLFHIIYFIFKIERLFSFYSFVHVFSNQMTFTTLFNFIIKPQPQHFYDYSLELKCLFSVKQVKNWLRRI